MVNGFPEGFTPGDRVYYHGRPVGFEWGTVIGVGTRYEGNFETSYLHIIFDDAHEEWVPERMCVHRYEDYIPF